MKIELCKQSYSAPNKTSGNLRHQYVIHMDTQPAAGWILPNLYIIFYSLEDFANDSSRYRIHENGCVIIFSKKKPAQVITTTEQLKLNLSVKVTGI